MGNGVGRARESAAGSGEMGKRERMLQKLFIYTRGGGTVAEWGSNGRRSGEASWDRGGAKPAPVFGEKRGRRWSRGMASGPMRERARGGREWQRRGRFSAAIAATTVADLSLGMTGNGLLNDF
nr:hypothetical protein LOC_Os03g33800 [Oryza sativa Japonica Group]